jgi:LuxR family maltose regulon positive regulatory protein
MRLNLRPGRVNRHALYVIRQAELGSRESPPPERAIRGSARVVSLEKPAPRVAVRAAEPSVVIQGRKPGRPAAVRGLVRRRRLFDRLSSAGPGEVVVLCAPAGSGKTALLRSWVESDAPAGPVAWVSVDRGERDAQRFWLAMVDALATAAGAEGRVEWVAATPAFAGEAVVEQLLSDLRALGGPVVLVIDDLHELRSSEALRLLERFLAGLPATLRIVLATREDPGLGLHRLRLAGALTDVRDSDLRFSLEETRGLLEASGIALSDEGSARLWERTEGWAAGLRLAAISLAGHPDPERFVAEFSGSERTVAGYLLAEVLERQPPDVRELLLRTSVLERINGPLADALTGRVGSEAILQDLQDANAFVVALDAGRCWFRYHHLLADLLQLELRRRSPEVIESLHRAAAAWFEAHGDAVRAIRHSQSAGDWRHAARLLADNSVDLVFDGRMATLRALMSAFPAGASGEDAELALAFTTARLYDGLVEEAATDIALAERLEATVPEARRRLFDLRLASARLWLACQRGDLATARGAMRSWDARTEDELARANDHRASALMNLGVAELWSLQLDEARRDLEGALALAHRIGRPYLEVGCLGHLALAAILASSRPDVSLRLSEDAVAIAERYGWGRHRFLAPAVAGAAIGLAWLGRTDDAERWLDRVATPQPAGPELEREPTLHYARAFVRLGQGRLDEALEELRATHRLLHPLEPVHPLRLDVRGLIVLVDALRGDRAAVGAALALAGADEADGAGMRLATAALALADGSPQRALDALAPMLDGRPATLHPRWATIHALLFDAAARDRLGDRAGAEASIERALELAEPDGVVLQFTLAPVQDLLERHPRHRTRHGALLTTILAVLAGRSPAQRREIAPLREDVSEAELRVLRYLPSNLSAPEIAAELFVSANTVRTHMRRIYAKLDAHSRGAAVERARDLGLLAPVPARARSA